MKPERSILRQILKNPALRKLALAGALIAPLLALDLTLSGCAEDCNGCGGCDEESTCSSACATATTQEQCLESVRSSNPVAPSSCCEPTTIEGCTSYIPSQDTACYTAAPANPPADMFGAAGAVSAASANLATANAAIEEAEKLDDPKPEVSAAPLADAAQSAAASDAGAISDLGLGKASVPNLGGLKAGAGPLSPKGKAEGGSNFAAGPGSATLSASGGDTTATQSAASEATGAVVKATAGAGTYAAARASGANRGDLSTGASFGGGSGDGDTQAESMNFGSASGASGSEPLAHSDSETPDDYLARIPINDSLFKRVEKKLQEKERYWSPGNPVNRLK